MEPVRLVHAEGWRRGAATTSAYPISSDTPPDRCAAGGRRPMLLTHVSHAVGYQLALTVGGHL
jgi:hypothetical protein